MDKQTLIVLPAGDGQWVRSLTTQEVNQMARKAKAPSIVSELIANELLNAEVLCAEPKVLVEEEVVEQSTGPSVLSSLVTQLLEPKDEPAEVVKKDKNEGVGQFIKKLISEGLGNKEILAIVHEQYGNANTTYACVAWYRNKMKKAGSEAKVAKNLDWLQNFAKANNLSEEAVTELARKAA